MHRAEKGFALRGLSWHLREASEFERALSQLIVEEFPDIDEVPSKPLPLQLQAAPGWEELWQQLLQRGWSVVCGPRGDRYWMPPGVTRAAPYRNRRDYFDSKKQVMQHLREQGEVVEGGESKAEVEEAPKPQGQGSEEL